MGGGGLVCPPNPFHRLLTPWPSAVGSRPSEPGEASHPHPALPRSCICKNALKMAKPWVKTPDLALCSASVRVLSLCRCAHFLRLRLGFICNVLKAKGSTLASGCAGLINTRAEAPPPHPGLAVALCLRGTLTSPGDLSRLQTPRWYPGQVIGERPWHPHAQETPRWFPGAAEGRAAREVYFARSHFALLFLGFSVVLIAFGKKHCMHLQPMALVRGR